MFVVVLLVLSHAATATAATLPPYYTTLGDSFRISSNREWNANGERAREFAAYPGGNISQDPTYYIWTAECEPGSKAVFTRRVDLLGPPSETTFNTSSGSPPVADWYEIWLNGQRLKRIEAEQSHYVFTKSQRELVRVGLNTLKVVVKLVSSPDACPRAKAERGVWFNFDGTFHTDLRVAPGQKAYYGMSVILRPPYWNDGPSKVVEGVLTISISTDPHFTYEPFPPCEQHPDYANQYICPFENFKPGTKRQADNLTWTYASTAVPGWFEYEVPWTENVTTKLGPYEVNTSNNRASSSVIVFCEHGASSRLGPCNSG